MKIRCYKIKPELPLGTVLKFVIRTGCLLLITEPNSEDHVSPQAAANEPVNFNN